MVEEEAVCIVLIILCKYHAYETGTPEREKRVHTQLLTLTEKDRETMHTSTNTLVAMFILKFWSIPPWICTYSITGHDNRVKDGV